MHRKFKYKFLMLQHAAQIYEPIFGGITSCAAKAGVGFRGAGVVLPGLCDAAGSVPVRLGGLFAAAVGALQGVLEVVELGEE